ncbi:MAG: hypothetical protein HY791_38680 [Deltaproteobacteria bacterium]|nr:hypothetical protein [Deltaproteobacteria bacterium]
MNALRLAISMTLATQACLLDYEALRTGKGDAGFADLGSHPDATQSDARSDAALDSGTPDLGFLDATADAGFSDADSFDAGFFDVGPDAGGDQSAWPEVLTPCPGSWTVLDQDYFDLPLSGWSTTGTFEAGHEWRTESGGLIVDMDGDANYWDRHLVRNGFSESDFAVMVDLAAYDDESWPQVHLRVDPTRPSERFYGIRLNSTREDLQLAVQTVADNASNPDENSGFPALALEATVRLVAQIHNEGPDVVLRAALYDLGDHLVVGSIVTHRYTGATAYTSAGGFAVSGWVGRSRFEHVRILGCR